MILHIDFKTLAAPVLRLAAALALLLPLTGSALAQNAPVPAWMNFQGRLARPDGTPVADGTYNIRFSLWDAATGGGQRWSELQNNVAVNNGVFAVRLGSISALPVPTFTANLWLEIQIGTDPPLAPRQSLASVAYAFKAGSVVDGSITGQSIVTNTITGAHIVNQSLTGQDIANNTITGDNIADGTILGKNIASQTITADKLAFDVLNGLGWLLGGNRNATGGFLGNLDNIPLEFRVNNQRVMSYVYSQFQGPGFAMTSVNTLGGYFQNVINPGVVGATIAGGGSVLQTDTTTVYPNTVTGNMGTIGGGTGNTAGVGATVAGGSGNQATGIGSAILGGSNNVASADYSFAAGQRAKARHNGAFVWADSQNSDFGSVTADQFVIRAQNGVGINTSDTVGSGLNVNGASYFTGNVGINGTLLLQNSQGPQNSLQASGKGGSGSNLPDGVHLGLDNNNYAHIELVTNGGKTYIDFSNANNLDYASRIISDGYTLLLDLHDVTVKGFFTNNSDRRFKRDITPLSNALDKILHLNGVSYAWDREQWKEKNFPEGTQIGFIAQEVEEVLPEVVVTHKDGYKSVGYINVVPVLVEAVKTLKKDNDAKGQRLSALETENTELKNRLDAIEAALARRDILRK